MAAPAAVLIFQAIDAALPGALAIWNAIVAFHKANPNLTSDQIQALATQLSAAAGQLESDTLATLMAIPSLPPAAQPAAVPKGAVTA